MLASALVSLSLTVGCGGGTSGASPVQRETVGDGADEVLREVPQDPVLPLPEPEPEAIVGDGCGCVGDGCACDAQCTFGPAPEYEDVVLAPEASETQRLARFWAVDRFKLDGGGVVYVEPKYQVTRLAKASPDECFSGTIGDPIVKIGADGTCPEGTIKKTNDAYVWGLTLEDRNLFFGTLANTLCLVEAGFLGITEGHVTSKWVCEFGASKAGAAGVGSRDFRWPNMFRYDLDEDELVKLDPLTVSTAAEAKRKGTTGFRSAGSLDGVAFLAGPASSFGVNVFAFDGEDGSFLGEPVTIGGCSGPVSPGPPARCPHNTVYTNVRQWAVANDGLYFGVGTLIPVPDPDPAVTTLTYVEGGAVLRWTGTKEDPFHFVEVGRLPADAANMIFHDDGRLYVTTWPNEETPAGLYRSPVVPAGGLTAANVDDEDWTKPLWLATFDEDHPDVPWYDPDRLTGMHYGGGALVSYAGKVLFGTMHVPFVATQDAQERYDLDPSLQTALGTHRSISVFVVDTPCDGEPTIRMLVGERFLPTYDEEAGGYTIRYDCAHRTGFYPMQGASGFGNFFNTYTWTMETYKGEAFVGTFDWSQLARVELETLLANESGAGVATSSVSPTAASLIRELGTWFPHEGGDLIRVSCGGLCAESVDGLGNDTNYGFRTMTTDGESLFIGTANPMNLDPLGGWELLELK